ncbi:MAG: glycosyltransferase [Luteimonas sp.]
MRLLLIAYEFPPSPSPQSLRWAYLARELHLLGHEVHVLTADLGGETPGLPVLPEEVRIHRTYPGPVRGMLAWLRKRRQRKIDAGVIAGDAAPGTGMLAAPIRPPRNWKQRISEAVQRIAEYIHYPDVRGEWRLWGRRGLIRVLDSLKVDAVISSHEPATTIELALLARRRGIRWIADIGDPVLASYTAPRWRKRAARIEHAMCREADVITVTTEATANLMQARHGLRPGILVVPQGYDARRTPVPLRNVFEKEQLELLYTGSFYSFRRPDALLAAVKQVTGVRLTIAAITVPEIVLQAAQEMPERIRLLGFRPHDAILDLQRATDILVNIANDDMTQIPGKVNEYFGARRPLLNLGPGSDPVSMEIDRLSRGWNCRNEQASIAERLEELKVAKSEDRLDASLDLSPDRVEAISWSAIAARVDAAIRQGVSSV